MSPFRDALEVDMEPASDSYAPYQSDVWQRVLIRVQAGRAVHVAHPLPVGARYRVFPEDTLPFDAVVVGSDAAGALLQLQGDLQAGEATLLLRAYI